MMATNNTQLPATHERQDPTVTVSSERLESAARYSGHGLLSGRNTTVRPAHVTRYQREVHIDCAPRDVFDFCLRTESVQAIIPDRIVPADGTPLVGEAGGMYEFRHWMRGAVPVRWVVLIHRFSDGREFVDHQLRGSFRWFRHTHTCLPCDEGTLYRDTVEFSTLLGRRLDRWVVRRELDRMFGHRHRRMRELLEP
jgi:ligand-binding SRPBCC domain-containing protein